MPLHISALGPRARRLTAALRPGWLHAATHRGPLMSLRPEEPGVRTAALIRSMTFTGARPALQDRLRELREAGYNHFAISIRHGHPGMLEDWADVFAGV